MTMNDIDVEKMRLRLMELDALCNSQATIISRLESMNDFLRSVIMAFVSKNSGQ